MKPLLPGLLLLALALTSGASFAADTLPSATFAPLHIENTRQLTVEQVDVTVNGRNVEITARIRNNNKATARSALSFNLPRFAWGGGADDYFDKDFPEFKVSQNGNIQRPARIVSAWVGGKDVTDQIAQARLDPLVVASDLLPGTFGNSLKDSAVTSLTKDGILLNRDNVLLPAWQAQVTYQWHALFAPQVITTFKWTYRVRPGFGIRRAGELTPFWAAYCMPEGAAQINQLAKGAEFFDPEEFILPLTEPAPARAHLVYTAQAINSSWVYQLPGMCLPDGGKRDLRPDGFEAWLDNASAFRFVAVFSQTP